MEEEVPESKSKGLLKDDFMSVDDIRKAYKLMESSGEEIEVIGGGSKELISAAEVFLGVTFPDDYRYFLEKFGALSFEAEEFYGITKSGLKAKSVPSVIFATMAARDRGDISNSMINVKSSGYGPSFCIDTSGNGDSAPVVEVGLSFKRDGVKVQVAKSFGEFFLNEIERAVADL